MSFNETRYTGAPCLNCKKRHEACHDTCEAYKEYRRKKDEYKQKRYNKDGQIISYLRSHRGHAI